MTVDYRVGDTRDVTAAIPDGSVSLVASSPPLGRRVEGKADYVPSATYRGGIMVADGERVADGVNQWVGEGGAKASLIRSAPTLGWTDCGHDAYIPGVVLDPFGGTGTTGAVAHLHGRDAVLIDLDARNADLYPARLDECRKALFGVAPQLPNQGALAL